MSIYLDAIVLVALFTDDPFTDHAATVLASKAYAVIVSDFAVLEFSSVVARFVRMRSITEEQARTVLLDFDSWSERACQRVGTNGEIISRAEAFVRRRDTSVRAADAKAQIEVIEQPNIILGSGAIHLPGARPQLARSPAPKRSVCSCT